MEILQASVVVDLYFILIPVVYRLDKILKCIGLALNGKKFICKRACKLLQTLPVVFREKNSCACVYLRKPEQNLYQKEILDAECYKIKNVIYFSEWRWTMPVNIKMQLHKVSHKRSLSQIMPARLEINASNWATFFQTKVLCEFLSDSLQVLDNKG